jgi:hypothetical protein
MLVRLEAARAGAIEWGFIGAVAAGTFGVGLAIGAIMLCSGIFTPDRPRGPVKIPAYIPPTNSTRPAPQVAAAAPTPAPVAPSTHVVPQGLSAEEVRQQDTLKKQREEEQLARKVKETREANIAQAEREKAEEATREAQRAREGIEKTRAAREQTEKDAARKLKLAKTLLRDLASEVGSSRTALREKARTRLREVIDKYPETKAAVEAKQELEKLDS